MADGHPYRTPRPPPSIPAVIDSTAARPTRRPRRACARPRGAGFTLAAPVIVGFVTYSGGRGKRPPEEFTPASVAIFASLNLGRSGTSGQARTCSADSINVPRRNGADARGTAGAAAWECQRRAGHRVWLGDAAVSLWSRAAAAFR